MNHIECTVTVNSKSVQLVKPADFAASFGPGFALKSIGLETTDEKVTEGVIRKILPWREYDEKQFDGETGIISAAPNRLANTLGSGNFEAGEKK